MSGGAAVAERPTSVEIPLQGTDTEVIELSFDELPDDADEVIHILKAEKAQLHLWVTIAIEYYRRDKKEAFVRILEKSRDEANIQYGK